MICDGNNNPLCIAGVFGGKASGVSEQTQDIFLESACFDAVSVRKTAKYHNLRTEAAQRFEKRRRCQQLPESSATCSTVDTGNSRRHHYGRYNR
ncbi:MAG: hypothetical protein IPL35_09915 [Sphingobacteriales bacterium]|nr:hypothetical protein [Sphingobacteriales bacterium]